MTKYSGDVTLPDGRQFHVIATFTAWEADTNACDLIDAEITDQEGDEIPVEIQNEEIAWANSYDGKDYLWSVCVDLVTQQPPDDFDDYED